jgi:hypothetical protein
MADQPANDPNNYKKGAADKTHGTHGRGGEEERLDTHPPTEPGFDRKLQNSSPQNFEKNLEGRSAAPGFGQEQTGGSAIDMRPDKSKS